MQISYLNMHILEWYLADLKPTGKNTIETVEKSLTDWLGYIPVYITSCHTIDDLYRR